MKAMHIRPPAVSGLFYPSDPTILTLDVDTLLEEAPAPALPGTPIALVAPHAGYAYSGPTAAAAYAALRKRPFRTAVIVAPSHREHFHGISVYDGDAYRTPLGLINVDIALREKLLAYKGMIKSSAMGHRDEHAVEVHLPFIQRINPDAKILPIVMGDQRPEYCRLLGDALAAISGDASTVLIASSDLSHFHPGSEARTLDAVAARHLSELQPMRLLDDVAHARCEACGAGPVAAVMTAALQLGAVRSTILHQCHSGDVTGDESRVVGYVSAALTREGAPHE